MLRVGLTGGLASGKTFVGKYLAQLGCHLIQADELGHQVLMPGGEAYQPVLALFGPKVKNEPGEFGDFIDRRKLGAIVFQDPAKLAQLSAIVHPAVRRKQESLIAALESSDPHGIVLVEAAILVETGSYRNFTKLIVAACSPEQQIERAMLRDSLSREEVVQRLSRQLPIEKKIQVADYVIDTSGTLDFTIEQTRAVYARLKEFAQ